MAIAVTSSPDAIPGSQRALWPAHSKAFGNVTGDRLHVHADVAARDGALFLELRNHAAHGVGRDRERDADRTAALRRELDHDGRASDAEVGRAALGGRAIPGEVGLVKVRLDLGSAGRCYSVVP